MQIIRAFDKKMKIIENCTNDKSCLLIILNIHPIGYLKSVRALWRGRAIDANTAGLSIMR
jgi:hypothetical protein